MKDGDGGRRGEKEDRERMDAGTKVKRCGGGERDGR